MKTHLIIILTLCSTCSLAGCAKIRQMTRKDYAVLSDPFLDKSPVAIPVAEQTSLTAAANAEQKNSAGFARVDIGGQNPPAAAGSEFQNVSRSRTVVPESTSAGLAKIAAGKMPSQQMPVASAAPEASKMDMAEMSAFMRQQAEASGLTQTAKDLESDFDAFAEARQKEWKQQVQGMKQQASGQIQQVADQASAFGSAMPSLPDMSFEESFGGAETAEPLIRQMSGQAAATAAQARATVSEIVAEMPNPFMDQVATEGSTSDSAFADNPFGFDEPAASGAQPLATSRPPLAAAASSVRSTTQNTFEDFSAFADSQLTGKINSQSAATPSSNPFVDLNSPATPTAQPVPESTAFGGQPAINGVNSTVKTQASPSPQAKLDDKFGFDVGWRPANMERR